jgi:translation initiation factor 1
VTVTQKPSKTSTQGRRASARRGRQDETRPERHLALHPDERRRALGRRYNRGVQPERVVYDTDYGGLDRCSYCRRRIEACICPQRPAGGRRQAASPKYDVVRVSRDRKGRRGKTVTVISGLPAGRERLQEIAAALKRLCGSGGTVVEGNVEIQGDHRGRVSARLAELGYKVKLAGG